MRLRPGSLLILSAAAIAWHVTSRPLDVSFVAPVRAGESDNHDSFSAEGDAESDAGEQVVRSRAQTSQSDERRSQADAGDAPIDLCSRRVGDPADAAAAQRIDEILDRPLKGPLDYPLTPLNVVLQDIRDNYELPILFDSAALEQVAISPESEVEIALGDVTLRAALDLILRQVDGLVYVVEHQVVLITTDDVAETSFEVRVFPVGDLVEGSSKHPYKRLKSMILRVVGSDTWAAHKKGGRGEIVGLPQGVLVVASTPSVQRQVDALIRTLRDTIAKQNAADVVAGKGSFEPRPSSRRLGEVR